MANQLIMVLDFGGQYKQLIARCVREAGVYSTIEPGNMSVEEIKKKNPIGIILTGGPNSVYADGSPKCDPKLFGLGIPILGICYGMQLMAYMTGGKVEPCSVSEYGQTRVQLGDSLLFEGLKGSETALMSHTDRVVALPEGFKAVASTADCAVAAMECAERGLYAVQFHPEVERTPRGKEILSNFVFKICGAKGDYSMSDFIDRQIGAVRAQVGDGQVLLALSGGVDSSVCAALLSKAIPGQLICIFVDHGCMRKDEGDQIEAVFSKRDLKFVRVNAGDRFLKKLEGVTEPEKKRKIIGAEFINVFEDEAKKHGKIKFLAQGTIYPDVIESGKNNSANIKSHHNVGGLPDDMDFKELVEPLRSLFKDEVRAVGRALGLPKELVERQPFPGPGLAIRCIGEVSKDKLDILREADAILREEIEASGEKVEQYFAVLTGLRSVGVMGDGRTYDYTVALRAVNTTDFMTCEYARLPYELLDRVTSRIANEVGGVNRVVYDITGKPPATIEWE